LQESQTQTSASKHLLHQTTMLLQISLTFQNNKKKVKKENNKPLFIVTLTL